MDTIFIALTIGFFAAAFSGWFSSNRRAQYASPAAQGSASRSNADLSVELCPSPVVQSNIQEYPDWATGENNPAVYKGINFTVPEVENLPDLHGNPADAHLVLFMGGNYYFVMPALLELFENQHPELKGKIFYETLPPGVITSQLEDNNTITIGNFTLSVEPDVFQAGRRDTDDLIKRGMLTGPAIPFLSNKLTIMVPKNNPAKIRSLKDLAKPCVRVVMPNPEIEGIASDAIEVLFKAGGKELVEEVYEKKVLNGETIVTHLHHRQTPHYLMEGKADVGITWLTEAKFQESIGNPISWIKIPDKCNKQSLETIAMVKNVYHSREARKWIEFITTSPAAKDIFKHFGFNTDVKTA